MPIPTVSIILPVRNEIDHIVRCVESIFGQDSIDTCEVIAVDGMSNDGTREALETLRGKFANLLVIDNPGKKVTTAVNLGIERAKSAVIMRMDAHAVYAPDYIASCLRVAARTGAANVGGHAFALPSNGSTIANAIALAHHSPFGLGGASFRNIAAQGYVETVWPGCFKREVFEKVGLLREELERSEDIELNYRLRKAGYTIYLSPEIKLCYFCRPTLGSLWRQRRLDGKGIVHTLRINAGAVRPRHLAPMFAVSLCCAVVLWGIAAIVFRAPVPFHGACAIAAAGAALYGCGTVLFALRSAFSVREINAGIPCTPEPGVQFRRGATLLLPLVFTVLHFSYGMGSLEGLFKSR